MKRIVSLLIVPLLVTMLLAMPTVPATASAFPVKVHQETHTLVILHPHSEEFAQPVIDDFIEWVQETKGWDIDVTTIQKDSHACYEQVVEWNGNPEADIWWGGGEYYFEKARGKGLLEPYTSVEDANIPDTLYGWRLKSENREWYAAALSGFGFMWNKDYLQEHGLPEPETWEDLAKPIYHGHICMCDPAKSGSTTFTVLMLLQYFGWEKGFQLWANITGNVGFFTTSSHDVPTRVALGEYGIGIVIDYYAFERIRAGENIGFSYGGATTISPDPVGILKGAPHLEEAKLFIDYITSKRGQEKVAYLRAPIRPDVETTDPVKNPYDPTQFPLFEYNTTLHGMLFGVARALFSNWLVINHEKAFEAYEKIKQCEEQGLYDDPNYIAAVNAYLDIPDDVDTLEEAIAIGWGYKNYTAGWQNWGATKFQEALDKANKALGAAEAPSMQFDITTAVGIAIVIIIVAVIAAILLRKRKI